MSPYSLKTATFLLGFFVLVAFRSVGQTQTISGKIVDENNAPLPYINVFVSQLNRGAISDEKGQFEIADLKSGSYELTISGVGFNSQVVTVNAGTAVVIKLEASSRELAEITIQGKTETQVIKEQSIKAEVINTRVVATQPATMIELMNRSSGIRVRQTGGLGAAANLMVNGFQDRAIKYFRDGIPMDYLGAGYNFALVPVNMLDRIEVYKGVLPAALGADALGGGLNMVTKKPYGRYGEASYEVASFNTHRASLNLFYQDTTRHFFVGGEGFFNHSDNNYEVTIESYLEKIRLCLSMVYVYPPGCVFLRSLMGSLDAG